MEAFITQSDNYSILESLTDSMLYREYKALRQSDGVPVLIYIYLPDRQHSTTYLEGFRRQAELLTLVEHPNILQVLDYGESNAGPFLVSDYFEGLSLKTFNQRLGLTQAAHLMYAVADALDNLHTQNLFHGMLEPEFIRVSLEGQVKLFGFGLYPILNFEDRQNTPAELVGVGIGNVAYISPEQLSGHGELVQKDLYAVGAIFYRLLTGRDPFQAGSPMRTIVQRLAHPLKWPRGSNRIAPVAVRIIQKALAQNPEQRFRRAEELRNIFEALSFGKSTRIKVSRKIMRGAPTPLFQSILLFVLILLLFVSTAGGLWHLGYLERWIPTLAEAMPPQLTTPTKIKLSTPTVVPQRSTLMPTSTSTPMVNNTHMAQSTRTEVAFQPQSSLPRLPVLLGEPLPFDFKALTAESAMLLQEVARYGSGKLIQAAWSPTSDDLAIASTAGVYIIGAQEAKSKQFINLDHIATAVAFSQNGDILAIGLDSGEIVLWSVDSKQEVRKLSGHSGQVSKLIFARNGKMLFSSSYDHTIRRWDFQTGQELQTIAAHASVIRSFDISKDSRFMVTGGDDGLVKYWDVDAGKVLYENTAIGAVWSVALSPKNDRYTAGTDKGMVFEWFVSTHNLSVDPYKAGSAIWTVLYKDDTNLLFFTDDGIYQNWTLSNNNPTRRQLDQPMRNRTLIDRLGWSFEYNRYLAWNPNSNLAALVTWSGTVQIFEGTTSRLSLYEVPYEDFKRLAISPDSRSIMASGERDTTFYVKPDFGDFILYDGNTYAGQPFSPDSQMRLIQKNLYEMGTYHQLKPNDFPADATVGYALGGNALIVSTLDETWVYDTATKNGTYHRDGHVAACRSIFQHHDGALLAVISKVHFSPFETEGIRWFCNMLDHAGVNNPAISPDFQRMGFINGNGLLEVWDTENAQPLWRAELEHETGVMTFNPDHNLLATGGEDGSITVWNVADGGTLITLRGHFQQIKTMQFSPDGKYLATAGSDGTIRLWGVLPKTGDEGMP